MPRVQNCVNTLISLKRAEMDPLACPSSESRFKFGWLTCFRAALMLIVTCIVTRYTIDVIRSFRHKGLAKFFFEGSKAGIQPKHEKKLRVQLTRLEGATSAIDMNLPGWDWHPLSSDLDGHWAVSVNGNWRLVFTFEGTDAILVDYRDYH